MMRGSPFMRKSREGVFWAQEMVGVVGGGGPAELIHWRKCKGCEVGELEEW